MTSLAISSGHGRISGRPVYEVHICLKFKRGTVLMKKYQNFSGFTNGVFSFTFHCPQKFFFGLRTWSRKAPVNEKWPKNIGVMISSRPPYGWADKLRTMVQLQTADKNFYRVFPVLMARRYNSSGFRSCVALRAELCLERYWFLCELHMFRMWDESPVGAR